MNYNSSLIKNQINSATSLNELFSLVRSACMGKNPDGSPRQSIDYNLNNGDIIALLAKIESLLPTPNLMREATYKPSQPSAL